MVLSQEGFRRTRLLREAMWAVSLFRIPKREPPEKFPHICYNIPYWRDAGVVELAALEKR